MSTLFAGSFDGAPVVVLEDPGASTSVPTNVPTVLEATTRYARATEIAVTGRVAPGQRVTFTATAGNAWTMELVRAPDGRLRRTPGKLALATPAELRQLRWRVHSGGVLLVDQRPGEQGDAVSVTLPTQLPGETVLAGACNDEPLVRFFRAWWVEDAREPGGRRSGRGGALRTATQLARIMGYGPGAEDQRRLARSHVEEALPALVAGFAAAGMGALEQAHFLAQVAVETGGLRSLVEQRSDASAGAKYAASNGNQGAADGAAFKGRGVLQTTGYDNYRAYFSDEEHARDVSRAALRRRAPELAAFPDAVDAGLYFRRTRRCDEHAALRRARGAATSARRSTTRSACRSA